MKNQYLKNLNKIEFAVTYACTGKCKHCSEGEHGLQGERIEPSVAAEAVEKICSVYGIKTVMAFGGEPLLHPEAVYAVMNAAYKMNVPKRQVITNGYFSKDPQIIRSTARRLAECSVNDLLLSADAFHQETIPLETVKLFAKEAKNIGIPIKIQPAWLVGREDDNPYNRKTREILKIFEEMQIPQNEGNVVFPEGNALKYLSEYFKDVIPKNPYTEDPYDVKCISFSPNGDVLNGNVYERDITDIIKCYFPSRR